MQEQQVACNEKEADSGTPVVTSPPTGIYVYMIADISVNTSKRLLVNLAFNRVPRFIKVSYQYWPIDLALCLILNLSGNVM